MDTSGIKAVTASKDCSIAVSEIASAGLIAERQIPDVHDGVVKCVKFSETRPGVFASCGNDRCIVKATEIFFLLLSEAPFLPLTASKTT